MDFSVRKKIFFGMICISALFILSVTLLILTYIGQTANHQISISLNKAGKSFQINQALHNRILVNKANNIAHAPHLQSTLGIPGLDQKTLYYGLREIQTDSTTSLLLVLDEKGLLMANANKAIDSGQNLAKYPGIQTTLKGSEYSGTWEFNGNLYRVAAVPILTENSIMGILVVGETINSNEFISEVGFLTGNNVLILYKEDRYTRIHASLDNLKVSEAELKALNSLLQNPNGLKKEGNKPFEIMLGANKYLALHEPLGLSGWDMVFFRSTRSIEQRMSSLRTTVVIISILFFLSSMALSYLLSFWITKPLRSLGDMTSDISSGNFDTRVKIQSKDEFADLGRSFNQMASDLKRSHEGLEEKVKKRTAELSESNQKLQLEIEERIKAESKIVEHEEQIRQMQKMEAVGLLAGGIAHDFNNILTAIKGYVARALNLAQKNPGVRANLIEASRGTERAAELTQQILLFSRKKPMQFVSLSLDGIIHHSYDMLKRLIGEGIELILNLNNPATLMGDRGSIEQILLNLTLNGRDALPNGGRITITTFVTEVGKNTCEKFNFARPGKFVVLQISDNGTGINQDVLPRIYEPFFSTKDQGKGTGMGLAVVYGIVKKHKGWIIVDSTTGKGSTFEVYFPAVNRPIVSKKKIAAPPPKTKANNEKILVIEDNPGILNLLEMELLEHGYQVLLAKDCKEASAIFEKEKDYIDLILSDVVLPDGKGPNMCQKFLEEKPDVKIIIASGYSPDSSDWEKIRELGMPFIQKPYSLDHLRHTIVKQFQ